MYLVTPGTSGIAKEVIPVYGLCGRGRHCYEAVTTLRYGCQWDRQVNSAGGLGESDRSNGW